MNSLGTYGAPEAGEPIQYDELRIEHGQGEVEIVVYNRAILLFTTDGEAVRRIHWVRCRLDETRGRRRDRDARPARHAPAATTGPFMTNATFAIGGDIDVRRLGFGAMRITGPGTWGPPDDPVAARALLRRAVELGVQLIDTSDAYGPGVSEELIAEALAPYDGVLIATKGGYERSGPGGFSESGELTGWTPNGRPEHLRSACEASLRRLELDRIDLYQLHTPDPTVPFAEPSRCHWSRRSASSLPSEMAGYCTAPGTRSCGEDR